MAFVASLPTGRRLSRSGWCPSMQAGFHPDSLAVIGFPTRGSGYWDRQTVQGTKERYGGSGMEAWVDGAVARL